MARPVRTPRHVLADVLDGGVHPRLHFGKHAFQIVEIHSIWSWSVGQ